MSDVDAPTHCDILQSKTAQAYCSPELMVTMLLPLPNFVQSSPGVCYLHPGIPDEWKGNEGAVWQKLITANSDNPHNVMSKDKRFLKHQIDHDLQTKDA